MQRRRLLQLGLASAAVLAVAGGTLAWMGPGLVEGRLAPGGREVFRGVARGVLDGILPQDSATQRDALGGLLDRIDILVGGLPAPTQDELSQLVSLLASAPGRRTLAGLAPAWQDASALEVQDALHSMRFSSLLLRRQAYHALHDIVNGAYFAEPATWAVLGYPGPQAI